jgi:hypothetical protein
MVENAIELLDSGQYFLLHKIQHKFKVNFNVTDLSIMAPLFFKRGLGEIFQIAGKIPLYPPLYPKGHKIKGDTKGKNP